MKATEMVAQMDKEGFGMCSNIGACEAECPKEISLENIARMNRGYSSEKKKKKMKSDDSMKPKIMNDCCHQDQLL